MKLQKGVAIVYKDRVITGALIGLLANAVKLTVNYISFLLGFTDVVFWQIVAAQFLERQDLFKPVAYFIGGVADLTATAALGVAFLYLIHYIGSEYLWLKGIGFGMLVWAGLFGMFFGRIAAEKLPPEPSGILVTIAAHFVFGVALAFFTWRLWEAKRMKD